MENQRYYHSEEDEKDGTNTSRKRPAKFSLSHSVLRSSSEQTPEAPRRAERIPLEGVITWRERSDEEVRRRLELNDEGIEKKKDDSEKDEDKTEKKPKEAQQERAAEGDEKPLPNNTQLEEVFAYPDVQEAETVPRIDQEEQDPAQQIDDQQIERHERSPRTDQVEAVQVMPSREGNAVYVYPEDAAAVAEIQPAPVADNEAPELHDDDNQQPVFASAPPYYTNVQGVQGINPNAAGGNGNLPPTIPTGQNMGGNVPPQNPGNAPTTPGNIPPQTPGIPGGARGNGANQPPFNPWNPNSPTPSPQSAEFQSTTASPAMPIEHPHYTYNRDPRLGPVAATLGLGLVAEHIGRKRADRKLEKRVNERADQQMSEQRKEIDAATLRLQEKQRQFAVQQDQLNKQIQDMQSSEQLTSTTSLQSEQYPQTASASNVIPGANIYYQPSAISNEQVYVSNQQPPQQPAGLTPVQQQPQPQMGERVIVQQHPEQLPSEQISYEADGVPQQPDSRQRVEHSAWHTVVVDEHGREIAGATQYGEGFQRERQQETMTGGSMGAGSSSAHSSQGVATPQGIYAAPSQFSSLPSGMTTPSLPQGQPTHVDPQHQLPATQKQQVATNITNPWFWIMLALIIAAFFTAALV